MDDDPSLAVQNNSVPAYLKRRHRKRKDDIENEKKEIKPFSPISIYN